MLIALALVAWSSANAASAMPKDVIRTTYDFTTSNITYTLASVSNADMESYHIKREKLSSIKKIREGLLKLIDSPEMFKGNPIIKWRDNIVKNLLELQVTKWIHDKLDESKVFEELKLHKTNNDPLNSPVFFQWFNFVEKSYSSDKAYEVILKRVFPYYKSMNALVGALDAAASKKAVAQYLLNYQFDEWKTKNKDAAALLEILGFDSTNDDPFKNPALSAWVDFVKLISSNDLEASKTMLSSLKTVYKDNLDSVLSKGTKTKIDRLKRVAHELQGTERKRQKGST
ncbi:unnamed protein product [Peronospora farinosa]|uniref:RxLR effector protein n=1 Tax=Peronospora farinosa TaxID=134698 RepID=A0AAV0TDF3_9STRA|nr:unnamed protein product [Peronospora farinosa]